MGSVQPEQGQGLREGGARNSCRKQGLVSSFYPENQAHLVRAWMIVTLLCDFFSFFFLGGGVGGHVKNYFAQMRVEIKYQVLSLLVWGYFRKDFSFLFHMGKS